MIRAYVLVTASAGRAQHVADALRGSDGIVLVDAITGEYDVIAQVEANDIPGIGRLILDGSSPRTAWSRRSRASRSDPGLQHPSGARAGRASRPLRDGARAPSRQRAAPAVAAVLDGPRARPRRGGPLDVALVHGHGTVTLAIIATAVWCAPVTSGSSAGPRCCARPMGRRSIATASRTGSPHSGDMRVSRCSSSGH